MDLGHKMKKTTANPREKRAFLGELLLRRVTGLNPERKAFRMGSIRSRVTDPDRERAVCSTGSSRQQTWTGQCCRKAPNAATGLGAVDSVEGI
jgi:hypothetical protein